jgi:hypothetical protein
VLRGNREEYANMGRVLSFTPRSAAGGQPPRTFDTAAAVIIFPGIRYERPKEGADRADGSKAAGARPVLPGPVPRH